MELKNVNLVELDSAQVLNINGGAHVPANDWGNFKKGVGKVIHEVGDFFKGIYDGLG